MKNLLKMFVLACFICVSAGFALAEAPSGGKACRWDDKSFKEKSEKMHQKRIERLTKELDLSKEQAEKISNVIKDGWENLRVEREKMRKIAESVRQETDSRIEKLLTPEQVEKFRKHRAEMRKKFEKRAKKWGKCD